MHKITPILIATLALPVTALLGACRGEISTRPPIHIVPNMDFQDKLKAQSESRFPGWKDHRGMREPVAGTVARGSLGIHSPDPAVVKLHTYTLDGKTFVGTNPVPVSQSVLERGRERFRINCAVCHGLNGRGRGIVGRRLTAIPPPSYLPPSDDDDPGTRYKPETLAYSDWQLFNVITNGSATMQPYKYQVSVEDRWAIIHYIRVLQYRVATH